MSYHPKKKYRSRSTLSSKWLTEHRFIETITSIILILIYQSIILTLTVITPSFPTFFIALEIRSPIVLSPFAEIVATWSRKIKYDQL